MLVFYFYLGKNNLVLLENSVEVFYIKIKIELFSDFVILFVLDFYLKVVKVGFCL